MVNLATKRIGSDKCWLGHRTELLTEGVADLEHSFHVTLEATGGGGGGVASRMSPSHPLVPYRIEPGDAHFPASFPTWR